MNNKYLKISLFLIIFIWAIAFINIFQISVDSSVKQQPKTIIYRDKSDNNSDIIAYDFTEEKVTIISFIGNFDFIYNPQQSLAVKNVANKLNYRYIINGSFFEITKEHAGFLSLLGQQKTPLKKDQQLSHIVKYNRQTGELNFIESNVFQPSKTNNFVEFQTGPLIIENHQITDKYIKKSFNGFFPYKRALLAYTKEDHRKYFIITKKDVKLDELAKYLLSLSIFSGKTLNIINLDGGPSVALYSKSHSDLNFNENAILPILLGIK